MARIRVPISNFQFGEVSPSMLSRTDTKVYASAAKKVENFFLRNEGGLLKRFGTRKVYEFDTTVDTSPLMTCPKCVPLSPMNRIKFLGDAGVYLDRCSECALLWLDKNELDKINQTIQKLNDSEAEWSFWMKVRLWASYIVT